MKIATCGDGGIQLWDVTGASATRAEQDLSQYAASGANTIVWNHSCQVLGCGAKDGTITLIAVQNATRLTTFSHGEEVTAMAFSDTSRYLCSASRHFTKIWDLRQATKDTRGTKPIKIYSAPSPIACVAFDNDQKQLAAACGKTIQLYDLTTGKVKTMRFKSQVNALAYSPTQNKRLLTASAAGTVCLLDTASCRVLRRFGSVHPGPGGATSVAFGPGSQTPVRFYSCGVDGTAVMYSMDPSSAPVTQHCGDQPLCTIDSCPDATAAVIGDETGRMAFIDFHDETVRWSAQCWSVDATLRCVRVAKPSSKVRRRRTPGSRSRPNGSSVASSRSQRHTPASSVASSARGSRREGGASRARSVGTASTHSVGTASPGPVEQPKRQTEREALLSRQAASLGAPPVATATHSPPSLPAATSAPQSRRREPTLPPSTPPRHAADILPRSSSSHRTSTAKGSAPAQTQEGRRGEPEAVASAASGAVPSTLAQAAGLPATPARTETGRERPSTGVRGVEPVAAAAAVAPASGIHFDVERASETRLRSIVTDVMEPLIAPVQHAVRDLHLELLRQMQMQQMEFSRMLVAQNEKLAAVYAELEAVRKENTELKRMY